MENRLLSIRLTSEDWQKIYGAKGDKSVSQFVRNAIEQSCRNEQKDPRELIQSLREMKADLDYLKQRIERTEDTLKEQKEQTERIENALIQILEVLKTQPKGSGKNDKMIADCLYLIGQAHDKRGWNNLNKEQQQWVLDTLKER